MPDPLTCPACRAEMKVIAFITNYAVIDKIIHHLGFTFTAKRPRHLSARRNYTHTSCTQRRAQGYPPATAPSEALRPYLDPCRLIR